MLRSTASSDTKRFDAGHQAKRIFVSALFACLANAPKGINHVAGSMKGGEVNTLFVHKIGVINTK